MQPRFTPAEIRIIVFGAMLAMSLAVLEQTIVATALPPIAADLNNFSQVSWVVTAYLLASTCVTPIVGKLSDQYGRRITLVASLAVFVIASALCALSTSMTALALARALQGIGGGGLIGLGQTVIAEVVERRERGRYSAYFSTLYAAASVLGPLVGGILTQYWGWPLIFWINVPLGLAALLIAERVLRKLPVRAYSGIAIDYASIALLCAATTGLLLLVSLGGKRFAWLGPEAIALGTATLALGLAFARRQRSAADPIFAPRLLGNPLVLRILVTNALFFVAYLAVTVLAPIYFQVAHGKTTVESGFLMVPMMLATSVGAVLAGRYLRSGRYKLPPVLGLSAAVLALLPLAFFADRMGALAAALALTLFGLGIGPVFTVSNVSTQNAVESRDLGAANTTLAFVRALGGALGVAAGSAIVLGVASATLPAGIGIEDLVRQVLPEVARANVARAFGAAFAWSAATLAASLAVFASVREVPH